VELDLVKIVSENGATNLSSVAADKSLVLDAKFHNAVTDFTGTVGLPNLARLNVILTIPEYRENAQVNSTTNSKGEMDSIVFDNANGDFQNVYRLMGSALVNSKINSLSFNEPKWDVRFTPQAANIQRFKYQAQALSDNLLFQTATDKGNLTVEIGDPTSHQGNFVFQTGIKGTLKKKLSWPVKQVLAVLSLAGDKEVLISDAGALMITVDSGVAAYKYIIMTHQK
jgi:hypothetical protein